MLNYEAMAKEFCEKTSTKVIIDYKERNWGHDIYRVTIKRNRKQFSFDFTQSIYGTNNGEVPTEYDILACLTKYEVGTFEEFCRDFGYELYDEEYRGRNKESHRIYKAVVKEYNNVMRLFSDVIEELSEIA